MRGSAEEGVTAAVAAEQRRKRQERMRKGRGRVLFFSLSTRKKGRRQTALQIDRSAIELAEFVPPFLSTSVKAKSMISLRKASAAERKQAKPHPLRPLTLFEGGASTTAVLRLKRACGAKERRATAEEVAEPPDRKGVVREAARIVN